MEMYNSGKTISEMASEHERTKGAIVARLAKILGKSRQKIREEFN